MDHAELSFARSHRYQQRVRDLFGNGTGGLKGTNLLDPQTASPATSRLFGGTGSDWFWFADTAKSATTSATIRMARRLLLRNARP